MNLFIKLLIAILVIGLLLPFTFLKDKHGNPMLSVKDLNFPSVTLPELSMPDFLSSGRPKIPGGGSGFGWRITGWQRYDLQMDRRRRQCTV